VAGLTISQRRLWFAESASGQPPAQVLCLSLDRSEVSEFLAAAEATLSTFPLFRQEFHLLGDLILQEEGDGTRLAIEHVALPGSDLQSEIAAAIRRLDRNSGPLAVLRVLMPDDGPATVVLAAHSLVSDPETLRMVLAAMAARRSGTAARSPPSFLDYAVLEQGDPDSARRAAQRWQRQLAAGVDTLPLASRGAQAGETASAAARAPERVWLDRDALAGLRRRCAENGWSLMAALYTGILTAVARHYEVASCVAYFTTSLRNRPELSQMPGHFTHFLPIGFGGGKSGCFQKSVTQVQAAVLDALAEPYLPLEDSVRLARPHVGSEDCFQLLFTHLATPPASSLASWRIRDCAPSPDAGFALHFVSHLSEDGCELALHRDSSRVDAAEGRDILELLSAVILDRQWEAPPRSRRELRGRASAVPKPDLGGDADGDEAKVHEAWERVIGGRAARNQNFFDAGGSSITLPLLARAIENATAVRLTLAEILANPTIEGIGASLRRRRAASAPSHPDDMSGECLHQLACLYGRAFRTAAGARAARNRTLKEGRGALVVAGATGFLGRHLVRALLRETTGDIVCLARARRGESAADRIAATFETQPQDDRARLIPVEADLAESSRPLTDSAAHAWLVVNAAAAVNFTYPTQALLDANVNALLPLLRSLDDDGGRLIHISTLGIYDFPKVETEGDGALPPGGGYPQTKWLADVALERARSSALRVDILRPGWVIGSEASGDINPRDLIWRLLRAALRLGAYPDIDFTIHCSSVEQVAAAVARRVRDGEGQDHGRSYNLPGVFRIRFSDMFEQLQTLGHPLAPQRYEDWWDRAWNAPGSEESMAPLLDTIRPGRNWAGLDERSLDSTEAARSLDWPTLARPLPAQAFRRFASSLAPVRTEAI
jgi:thioester reductase-like protein